MTDASTVCPHSTAPVRSTAPSGQGAVVCSQGSLANVYRCVIARNSGPGLKRQPQSMGSIGHCIVRDNEGNGIEHWYCGGSIARSTIFSNQGCGIWVTGPTYQYPTTPDAPMLLWMNLIYGNHGGEGGGVQCSNGANPILRNNTIVRNFGGFDAGDPQHCVGDEPAPNGGRCNMGAYGTTERASRSPATRPGGPTPRGGGRPH